MDDYLSEKEQWEWLKEKVRENAPAVLLAIVLGAGAVFGWRWWQSHRDARQLEAGARYMQMVQSLERDHAGSPYSDQARLLAAHMYINDAQLDHAASELATVAEHSKDHELALVARQRLARVQIAQGKPDSALATLGATADPGAFAARYHEIRGDAYYAKGDKTAALSEYRSAQGSMAEGGDAALLQLKIADLDSGAAKAAPTAAATTPTPTAGTRAAGK